MTFFFFLGGGGIFGVYILWELNNKVFFLGGGVCPNGAIMDNSYLKSLFFSCQYFS